jgi:hypothetical protein
VVMQRLLVLSRDRESWKTAAIIIGLLTTLIATISWLWYINYSTSLYVREVYEENSPVTPHSFEKIFTTLITERTSHRESLKKCAFVHPTHHEDPGMMLIGEVLVIHSLPATWVKIYKREVRNVIQFCYVIFYGENKSSLICRDEDIFELFIDELARICHAYTIELYLY